MKLDSFLLSYLLVKEEVVENRGFMTIDNGILVSEQNKFYFELNTLSRFSGAVNQH